MDDRYRSYDGSNNNKVKPFWGNKGIHLLRDAPVAYADNTSEMAERVRSKTGENIPNPRDVSNAISRRLQDVNVSVQENNMPLVDLSDFFWVWTQFLEHELLLLEFSSPLESVDVQVMPGDPVFSSGGAIPFNRSKYDKSTGTGVNNPRQQLNMQTAFLDGASIYGIDPVRASALRRFDGTGRLKSAEGETGDLLSYNLAGFKNAQSSANAEPSCYFLSGDIRVNEHLLITSMHTLFMREHNRLCMELPSRYPYLAGDDEATYQFARKIIGAIIQSITYNEYLPLLLGDNALNAYTGYKEDVNPSISSVFAAVAFRFSHSMMPANLRLGKSRKTLQLREIYFNPRLLRYVGIEPLLEGRFYQRMQAISSQLPEDLRNLVLHYNGITTQSFLDFAALTIQRGRDHGLPDYNTLRQSYGLTRLNRFDDLTTDQKLQDDLEKLYQSIDHLDPWVGAMIEKHLDYAQVGAINYVVMKDQFERLRDGDRFWFENDPMLSELRGTLAKLRLSHVIRRNTRINNVPENIFKIV
jgi:hypothetical protein